MSDEKLKSYVVNYDVEFIVEPMISQKLLLEPITVTKYDLQTRR